MINEFDEKMNIPIKTATVESRKIMNTGKQSDRNKFITILRSCEFVVTSICLK